MSSPELDIHTQYPDLAGLPAHRQRMLRDLAIRQIDSTAKTPSTRLRRRPLVTALAVGLALVVSCGALAISSGDFLGVQNLIDRTEWTPPALERVGDRVEVARGDDWSFMAWRSTTGVCTAYAAGSMDNWARACGGASATPPSPLYPKHVYVFGVARSSLGGQQAIYGATDSSVSRVTFKLDGDRSVSAVTQSANGLNTDARFFIVRGDLQMPATGLPIRAIDAYNASGQPLEHTSIAP